MIIALVGPSHCDKSRVVADINKYTGGRFVRLHPVTTHPLAKYPVTSREFNKIQKSEILYEVLSSGSYQSVYLKSQFVPGKDYFYVVDDPRGIQHIASLHQPYAVVYISSSMGAIKRRIRAKHGDVTRSMARVRKVSSYMQRFAFSGDYSMYIDTSKVEPEQRREMSIEFLNKADEWLNNRKKNENHMKTCMQTWGGFYLEKILKETGYAIVP